MRSSSLPAREPLCSAQMRAVRSVSFIAVVGLLPACATQGVLFDGHAEPRIARPAELGEVETLPAGYDRIGRLRASCTLVEGAHPGDGAKLVDVDCTESRLMAALRERAAEVGACFATRSTHLRITAMRAARSWARWSPSRRTTVLILAWVL